MTEDQLNNEVIAGIAKMVVSHIKAISNVEGNIRSANLYGNAYFIKFENGTTNIQPLISKQTNEVTLDENQGYIKPENE